MDKSTILRKFSDHICTKFTSESTLKTYYSVGEKFVCDNHPDSIDKLTFDYIKSYLANVLKKHSPSTYNHYVSIIKILYRDIFKQKHKTKDLKCIKVKRKLKNLPRFDELKIKINAISNIKHKSILYVLISTGIRKSELLDIRIQDVDSSNKRILIKNGKGGQSGFVPLTDSVLELLKTYYRTYRPKYYLFEGDKGGKYTASSLDKIIKNKINKDHHPHIYRHLFATYMINKGVNHHKLSRMLRHQSEKSTAWYYEYDDCMLECNINPINELV